MALKVFGHYFGSENCQVEAARATFAKRGYTRETEHLKAKRWLSGHEFSEVRHNQPPEDGFVRSEGDGFGGRDGRVDNVIERAEGDVGGEHNATAIFV